MGCHLSSSGPKNEGLRQNSSLLLVELLAKTKKEEVFAKTSRLFSVETKIKTKKVFAKNSKNKVRVISTVYRCISITEKRKKSRAG